jgi:hypothetical protein
LPTAYQVGSFVPAESCDLTVFDGIYTRVVRLCLLALLHAVYFFGFITYYL